MNAHQRLHLEAVRSALLAQMDATSDLILDGGHLEVEVDGTKYELRAWLYATRDDLEMAITEATLSQLED